MTKLTDTQLVLLSAAAQRDDHIIPIGERLKGGVANAVAAKLISLGLAEERIVDSAAPFWRRDDDGQHIALVITSSGLAAIGLGDEEAGATVALPSAVPALAAEPCSGTKRSMVIDLLKRREGASLDDLIAATCWLPHTTRAALTGLRKKGFDLAKSKDEAGKTRYRIVMPSELSVEAGADEPANAAAQSEAASHEH